MEESLPYRVPGALGDGFSLSMIVKEMVYGRPGFETLSTNTTTPRESNLHFFVEEEDLDQVKALLSGDLGAILLAGDLNPVGNPLHVVRL